MVETLCEQAEGVRAGEWSAIELVDAALARIEATEPQISAFAHVLADRALARAVELDSVLPDGPLHGVPVAVKDVIAVDGAPTEANCAALIGAIPEREATVVTRLRSAGAVVIGKTNTHELAYGTSCPASFNPWDTRRMTGGSSGGNGAAVAARVVAGSAGTDTGGSVRIPASYCGITSIKPTTGAVPRDGVYLLSQTFDTVGPMARSALDCRLLLQVMAGRSPLDPYSVDGPFTTPKPVADMRIGVPSEAFHRGIDLDPRVAVAVAAAIEALVELVADVIVVDVPSPLDVSAAVPVVAVEPCQNFAEIRATKADLLGDDVRSLLDGADAFTALDVVAAHEARVGLQARFATMFATTGIDAFISPITPNHVPDHGAIEWGGDPLIAATTPYCLPVNAAWLPAVALPGGTADDGLPVGFQLIGPHWSDLSLAALGEAYQQVTDHHLQVPTI